MEHNLELIQYFHFYICFINLIFIPLELIIKLLFAFITKKN